MNTLRERVIFRMEKLGLNPSSLARILRERYGLKRTKQSTIQSLTSGRTSTFRKMTELAGALMTTVEWLSTGKGNESFEILEKEIDMPVKVVDRNFPFGPDTVPILGQANASSKAVMLNYDDPIGEFPRHPNQKYVKNAYYVRIYDESMEPRYYPRELAAVNGNMSPLSKEDCVIQLKNGEVYIKRFIKTTSKEVICAQLNPVKEWKCLLAEVKAIHAVVGRG